MNSLSRIPIIVLSILLWNVSSEYGMTQENSTEQAQIIKFSGYVKNDIFYDTRQTYAVREGNFLLFPMPEIPDSNGSDINARPNFNILAIKARVSAAITGPDAFGAKISGVVEGDFFGQKNVNINLLRLRHAYLKLQWSRAELLLGQYWHPLFIVTCYPSTISFNTGAPLQPFSRAPQIRSTLRISDNLKLMTTLVSQRDYSSTGPGGSDSKYLRDTGFPEVQFQWEYTNTGNSELSFGTGVGYKQLMPMISTNNNYKTSEKVNGLSVNGFLKYRIPLITVKFYAVYLENGSEFLSVSGYAVKDTIDPVKGIVSYTPLKTYCLWTDLHTNGNYFQFGLFSGYTENLGTREKINGPIYITANAHIKNLYRISPRLLFISEKTIFAMEFEYTSANYGEPNEHAIASNTVSTSNFRLLLSAKYKF